MTTNKITPEELWARQQISPLDVDYDLWNERRASIQTFSQMSQSCIFTVDVFKNGTILHPIILLLSSDISYMDKDDSEAG